MARRRAVQEKHLSWYEASLPLVERKKRGHFSTPPLLVARIFDACGYTPTADLAHMRVLDPACGSGNFLGGAVERLRAFARQRGLSEQESAALSEQNIWGFDPDPVSCFLAEMQVHSRGDGHARMHIHQADSLTLPWEPCVDVFVANPPYLATKNADLSGYRSVQRRGQVDSYLLFVDLALQVVRPGGWIGLVLPDPVLARTNAAPERTRLLQECTIHHLWHLAGVFDAEVGAVVIVAQKQPPGKSHHISWARERWRAFASVGISSPGDNEPRRVRQSLFLEQPHAELRYLLSSEQGTVFERLRGALGRGESEERRFAPLSEFLTIRRGEEIGRDSRYLMGWDEEGTRGNGRAGAAEVQTRGAASRSGDKMGMEWSPVLRGGVDIRPYETPRSAWYIAREAIDKPLERYQTPKLLVVKSTDRLQAALDTRGHVVLQTLYLLHLRADLGTEKGADADALYFFLALLNSQLLREYVYVLHTAYKWVQPQIEQAVLAHLPVPLVGEEEKRGIIERARLLERMVNVADVEKEGVAGVYGELEKAICELYMRCLSG